MMLSSYRVLDLTDNESALGPMILADLGADVVRVEPPTSLSPPSRSTQALRHAAFNRNKRAVALDLDDLRDRRDFLRLVANSDFLFENARLGAMDARGLGFQDLRWTNPRVVYVATTPFGQDGPYADFVATDLTLAAMGGMMAINGDADRAPIRISVPQCWLHAAAESAVAALVAHRRLLQTGEAQFVDVSVQAAVFWTLMNAMSAFAIQGSDFERNGGNARLGALSYPNVFACADGYTVVSLGMLRTLPNLLPLMVADGVIPRGWLTDENWPTYFEAIRAGRPVAHPLAELVERVQTYVARHTRQELLDAGLAVGVSFAPVDSIPDVIKLDQLEDRRFWMTVDLPGGERVRAPGPFVRLSRTPIQQRRGIPAVENPGPLTEEWQARTRTNNVPDHVDGPLPFSGLKVADFSWVGVGPSTAKYLADHGATTVRIETADRPDVLRRGMPFTDGKPGLNRSQYFASFNTSKWSIALDLKRPSGRDVALRLLAWADVCLESFTPGTMKRLGLDYSVARELNPAIIWVSSCLMGQTGPLAPLAGFGYHAAAIAGFFEVTGWPDRPPCGPFAPYTDTMANRFLAASLMAAIEHRRLTGEGQYIEESQLEAAMHFLAPEILRYQLDGTIATRLGNASPSDAPHGAYPCLGDDEWCAIAVETDDQWQALRSLLGNPEWCRDPALAAAEGRIASQCELDARIAGWTREQEPFALMERLQSAGIPAGVVQRSSDLLRDPQLRHRRFFRPLTHSEMGEVPYEGHQFRIRGYDSGPRFAAPALGEQSVEVMRDLLGMSEEEIAAHLADGALT